MVCPHCSRCSDVWVFVPAHHSINVCMSPYVLVYSVTQHELNRIKCMQERNRYNHILSYSQKNTHARVENRNGERKKEKKTLFMLTLSFSYSLACCWFLSFFLSLRLPFTRKSSHQNCVFVCAHLYLVAQSAKASKRQKHTTVQAKTCDALAVKTIVYRSAVLCICFFFFFSPYNKY